jgi:lipopolysaccharide assembly outer membrane protein LptD (OstA)
MKRILLLVLVLGFAVMGNAQTPQRASLHANRISREGNVMHLRGSVEITVGDVRVTADEADYSDTADTLELRGNVVMAIRPNTR